MQFYAGPGTVAGHQQLRNLFMFTYEMVCQRRRTQQNYTLRNNVGFVEGGIS
jgi:hypothetical protein